jgi:hypothetical protein
LPPCGVKVTLTVQKALTAIVLGLSGQLFVCAKSPGLVPVTAMLPMAATPGPLLVMVKLCKLLVVFTIWAAKVMLEGINVKEGPVAVLVNPVATEKKVPGALWLL